jgi:hypothetical protein
MIDYHWSLRLLVIAAFVMATSSGALAQSRTRGWVDLQVDCVVASDTNEGVDERLKAMGDRLRSLFNYSTYRLVSHQSGLTEFGRMIEFNLPGGRILNVQPRGIIDDMIAMQLILFQGPEPMMTTELRLKNHGMLIVGGPRYEKGMLIISIAANTTEPRPKSAGQKAPAPEATVVEATP